MNNKLKNKESINKLKYKQKHNLIPFIITSAMLIFILFSSFRTGSLPKIKLAHGIINFPLRFKDWRGIPQTVDPKIVKNSGAEEAFQATYFNSKNEVVVLYIGYRSSPFMETEEFFHSPTVCLPASGWKILEKSSYRIPHASSHYKDFVVTKLLVSKMGQKQLVYFWFQTKSKIARNIFENRFDLAIHALKRDNTYDITVHVYTPIKQNENVNTAQRRLDNFVRDLEEVMISFFSKEIKKSS